MNMCFQSIKLYLLILITVLWSCPQYSSAVSITTSTQDISYEVNTVGQFSISLSENVSFPVEIDFIYTPEKEFNIKPLPGKLVFKNETKGPLYINTTSSVAGHTIVKVNASAPEINVANAFVRIGVYKLGNLNVFSSVIGWLYFVCWSISFYPQVIENWKRKSVVGLNFDFLGLNITGFIAYSIFNIGLRFISEVQDEYHHLHPEGVIPVEINDVFFSVHAAFITAVTIGQCFIYERGNQLIARTTVAILALVWSTAGVFLLITSLGIIKDAPWLYFLYFFSYVKLAVTLTKYIPQVVYNYQRKSTQGWSIGTVLFDFVGGIFSIMQMFIIAYNYNDWASIFGNFTKFGLGAASVTFDVIFMVQHYILYRGKTFHSNSLTNLVENGEKRT